MALRFTLLVLAMVFTTPSVTGITITVTPSSNTLVEGRDLRIQCSENNLPGIDYMELHRNNQRMVTWTDSTTEGVWDTGYTGPPYQSRAGVEVTGSVTASAGDLNFFINNTLCVDAAEFYCRSSSAGSQAVSQPQNITVYGVTQYPTMNGGQECNIIDDPDCDKCTPDDPFAPKPKYIRKGERLDLVCSGQVGLPKGSNSYQWFKKNDRDAVRVRIQENITTTIQDPVASDCYTIARSTLQYYHTDLDSGLVLSCEVFHSFGGSTMTRGANTSVCIEGFVPDKITTRPGGGNPGAATAGLGGGEIAGIVIAVIAVIVLVVVLVYFLWYRRRDSGESYDAKHEDSTRETDVVRSTGPPVSSKPQHNSNYDTTGDDHRNNHTTMTTKQARPEREPLHYAELDLVRGSEPVNERRPPIENIRRTGQATPYAEIQLPL